MNWKNETINDLQNHSKRINSISAMSEQVAALENDYKSIVYDDTSHKDLKLLENEIVDNIAKRQKIMLSLSASKRMVKIVDTAMKQLADDERTVLEKLYIYQEDKAVDKLCEKLFCEPRNVYRIRDKALYNLTIAMYGYPEI